MTRKRKGLPSNRLTYLEIEVLYARMHPPYGRSSREIAGYLNRNLRTTEATKRRAFKFLGITTDYQLLKYRDHQPIMSAQFDDLQNPHRVARRFSERGFRSYESCIVQAVRNWPSATEFSPHQSLETFSQRFRDAMRAFNERRWKSQIDLTKWPDFFENKVVRITSKGTILIHDRRVTGFTAAKVDMVATPGSSTKTMVKPTRESIEAALTLLAARQLEHVDLVEVDPSLHNWLLNDVPQNYDVAVSQSGPGKFTLY